jgi:hypothetical protein
MKTGRSVFLIYGESTVTVSFKVPESKKDEICSEIKEKVLSKYENPKRVILGSSEKNPPASVEKHKQVIKKVTITSGEPVKKKSTTKSYKYVDTLPLGTVEVENYGSKGAIRELNDVFYTKRSLGGKLEIIQHESGSDALDYAEQNFI